MLTTEEEALNLDTLSVDDLCAEQAERVKELVKQGYLSIKRYYLPQTGEVLYEEIQYNGNERATSCRISPTEQKTLNLPSFKREDGQEY